MKEKKIRFTNSLQFKVSLIRVLPSMLLTLCQRETEYLL